MKRIDSTLITPIYVKEDSDTHLPTDPVYYLLTGNNLLLCRNHRFYRSCVPAPQWPTELAPHDSSLVLNFPMISQKNMEEICGFFGHVSDEACAEAIVLLAWDDLTQKIHTIVPRQVASVGRGWGGFYPIGVKYKFPQDLPDSWTIFCDIHSHCEMSAYASQTDIHDEDYRSGLHLVVGHLHEEPPQFHVEAVVDGTRFSFEREDVITGYDRRRNFPEGWLDQITVTNYTEYSDYDFDAEELDQEDTGE